MQIRNRENDMKDYRKVLLKGKASAISNSSQNSYFSSSSEVGYNRSALYWNYLDIFRNKIHILVSNI